MVLEIEPKAVNVVSSFDPTPLDFEVEKRVVKFFKKNSSIGTREKMYVIVRNDTEEGLGVVGQRYRMFQNRELLDFAKDVAKVDGMLKACGTFMNGQRVWVQLHMPNTVYGGQNLVTTMLIRNSHDSSQCLTLQMYCKFEVGKECRHQSVVLPMYNAKKSFRHLPSGKLKLDAIAGAVEHLKKHASAFAQGLEALAKVQLFTEERQELIKTLMGLDSIPTEKKSLNNFEKLVGPTGILDARSWYVNTCHTLSQHTTGHQSLVFGSLGDRIEDLFEDLKTRHFVAAMTEL